MRVGKWLLLACSVLGCGCQAAEGGNGPQNAGGVSGSVGAGVGGVAAGTGGLGGAGGVDVAGTGGVGGAGGAIMQDAGVPPVRGELITLRIAVSAVPSDGQEHVCVTLPTTNAGVAWVKSMHATLNQGSHHLIVDRLTPGAPLNETATPCSPTQGNDVTRLLIAQQHDTLLRTPEGTAFKLEAHQPIFLQLHYFNFGDTPINVEGVVELELVDVSAGLPIEVQSTFTGQMLITLGAGPGLAEFFYTPPGSAARPHQVFALTSHTHSLGIRSTIERVPNATAPESAPIHEALDWEEPPLNVFDPPLSFTGTDGVRLRCRYDNTTGRVVTFGTNAQDEMCFMWLYYY